MVCGFDGMVIIVSSILDPHNTNTDSVETKLAITELITKNRTRYLYIMESGMKTVLPIV